MKKPELLAPAGNMESLIAAIEAGCDAVYIGGSMFGARSFANNFNRENMKNAVDYTHSYGVKVYVTVNTLIYENEVIEFTNYISYLNNIGVDALIMQDIGMMDKIKQEFPDLEIHASTQMHIHNLEGVKFVENIGLTRAVLARETDCETIKKIKDNTNVELEIFIHGALCISYSGQCLMSSLIGNRSGNRGTCAGSCRHKYDVLNEYGNKVNEEKYNLSTRDLNSIENLGNLIEAGADSFKIEGRMKSPVYVYLVVSLYREAIDSYFENKKIKVDNEKVNDLLKTFNRKFTKGFLFNDDNKNIINPNRPNHMGIEIGEVTSYKNGFVNIKLSNELAINDGIRIVGNNDTGFIVTSMFKNKKRVMEADNCEISIPCKYEVKNNSKIYKTSDYNTNKKIEAKINSFSRKINLDAKITIVLNKPLKLEINDGTHKIIVKSNIVAEKPLNMPTSVNRIIEQLKKTGNSIYKFNNIDIVNSEEFFIPIKEVNELRRKAIEEINNKRIEIKEKKIGTYKTKKLPDFNSKKEINYYINDLELYKDIKDNKFQFLYLDNEIFDKINDNRKIRKISRVKNNFDDNDNLLMVGELGSINYYNNVQSDYSLNVVNSYSVALLHSLGVKQITLSLELENYQIKEIVDAYVKRYNKRPNLEVIIYGNEEVMISKFNLLKYYNLEKTGYLLDRFNNKYLIKEVDGLMNIYNFRIRDNKEIEFLYKAGINNLRYNLIKA